MHLKKLEMCGFKSFAEKTDIVFEPGVTCIIGPNGSGKSNVVDAIKWVLGTLSYKSVRGDEMMDVVFKGAAGIGPAGFAEVSLTLDNADRVLPLDFSEVTIARRLYRDGTGEYSINGASSRLKDVRDLLYGTGIGTDNYSIIEQGKIDKLVTTDPHGRRLVFDEAAGISKYRARKRETEQRLDKVTLDLEKLALQAAEVRTQLRSVRGQASRAVRYRELQSEYASKRILVLSHELRRLGDEAREMAGKIAGLEGEQEQRRGGLDSARRAVEEVGSRLTGLAGKIAEVQNRINTLIARAEYLDGAVRQARERVEELGRERERYDRERTDAAARLAEGETAQTDLQRLRLEMEGMLDLVALQIRDTQVRLDEAARECRRLRGDLEGKKGEAIEVAHKESVYRTDLAQTLADRAALKARRERVDLSVESMKRDFGACVGQRDDLSIRRGILEEGLEEIKNKVQDEERGQKARKEDRARLETELVALRGARDKCESRRETLRDLHRAHEGLGSGARELLQNGFHGVHGTVVDLLDAASENVVRIEAALGDLAGAVVVGTAAEAEAALSLVRSKGLDRTTVIPLERCSDTRSGAVRTVPGTLRAHDLIRTQPEHAGLVRALLGDVLFVEDAEDAGSILELWDCPGRIVTRTGDVFSPCGAAAAGARKAGLLARKVDLHRLETELGELARRIQESETRAVSVDEAIQQSEERLKTLRMEGYERGVALSETRTLLDQVTKRADLLAGELEVARAELGQVDAQATGLADRETRLETLIVDLQEMKRRVASEVESLTAQSIRFEESRIQIQEELTRATMERAQAEEKHKGYRRQEETLARDLERHREIVRRNEQNVSEIEARAGSVHSQIEGLRGQRTGLDRDIEDQRATGERLEVERREVEKIEGDAAERVSVLERDTAVMVEQINGMKIQQAQQAVVRDTLGQRAREEFQLDPEALPPEGEIRDWEALAREAEELRIKIAGFGTVNVVALEQLAELEERETWLSGQQGDLQKAKRELEDLIRKLNGECRIKFEKTLEFVREEFNSVFRKIFGGGKADIVLEQKEGVDPMEQGLDIIAKPPNKELTSISLLSGGEKSLTAFSLVMALFRANPSPFCILDEADAPLDESNVDKYTGLINDFVKETQFIVISHNKRTMTAADVLYGITMQTPGVSTKLSANLLDGGGGLDLLKERRDSIRKSRDESSVKKAQAIAEIESAAATALAELEEGENPHPDGGVAPTEPELPAPGER